MNVSLNAQARTQARTDIKTVLAKEEIFADPYFDRYDICLNDVFNKTNINLNKLI